MPWFPDFVSAVQLARRRTRAAGLADPVGQYFTALNKGDTHALEDVWPGEVVIYGPHAGEVRIQPGIHPRTSGRGRSVARMLITGSRLGEAAGQTPVAWTVH
jgi:hypothetical protein